MTAASRQTQGNRRSARLAVSISELSPTTRGSFRRQAAVRPVSLGPSRPLISGASATSNTPHASWTQKPPSRVASAPS